MNELTEQIDSTENEAQRDPVVQEVIETLPGYMEYMKDLRRYGEGLTFGDC